MRVVLVDDNPHFLALLRDYLVQNHLDVLFTARSGPEILERLEDLGQVDALVLDLAMPGMNGLEVTRHIRKHYADLRVVILTLSESNGHKRAALAAGADAFVGKSHMDSDLLPALIRERGTPPQSGSALMR